MSIFGTFFGRKPATPAEDLKPRSPPPELAGSAVLFASGRKAAEAGPATLAPSPGIPASDPPVAADVPEPPAPAPAPLVVTAPPPERDIRVILGEIETLGDSPELGLLRETLGAEPDGLFGFCTMYPPALITLLRNRFAGTGALEHLVTRPAWGHHYIVDQRFDFSWRSHVKVGQMADDAVLAHESTRLARLRDQLIRHLAGNQRLFVYAGPASSDHIAGIRAAMRGYGDNTLLHLVLADASNTAGQVAWHEDGLLRGYLSRYGSQDGKWDIAVEDWVAVCRAAHHRWKDSIVR